jgi:hypothetical protein
MISKKIIPIKLMIYPLSENMDLYWVVTKAEKQALFNQVKMRLAVGIYKNRPRQQSQIGLLFQVENQD